MRKPDRVILSRPERSEGTAKDLKMRRPRILRSFGVFAPQDDVIHCPSFHQ
jgi:hypothetical protein